MGEHIHEFRSDLNPLNDTERETRKRINNKMEDVSPEEYDAYAISRERDKIANFSKEKLMSFLDEDKKYKGLELGSGTGIYTKELNQIPNLDLVGVEIGRDMIDYGLDRERFNKDQVVVGDFQNIPFDDDSFDLGTGLAITRQREDISKFYSELKRVLKKNGIFFLPFIKASEKIIEQESQRIINGGLKIVEKGNWYILVGNNKE